MRYLLILAMLAGLCVQSVSGQFEVTFKVGSNDAELENSFAEKLQDEFAVHKDVKISERGKFGLLVEIIKRPVGGGEFDVFIATVSTTAAMCIVGMDEKGRVHSRQTCKEFLTSRTHIGRLGELDDIAEEIVSGFNGFVLEPLRGLEQ
ncbi:MAG: hypothetical protein OEM82_09465 [Acidobacteriota bacterium]|nr:hypothetical protein [Acidobacteriota bacterium]